MLALIRINQSIRQFAASLTCSIFAVVSFSYHAVYEKFVILEHLSINRNDEKEEKKQYNEKFHRHTVLAIFHILQRQNIDSFFLNSKNYDLFQ